MLGILFLPFPALGSQPGSGCDSEATLQAVDATCWEPRDQPEDLLESVNDRPTYELVPACGSGGEYVCYEPVPCAEGEEIGDLYDVLADGELVGQTCVTESDPEDPTVTPPMVVAAFRQLEWPASELVVQPPGGRTLVNFATNFYTENSEPSRQTVTLLGQQVVIEATPETYTWNFGDGQSDATRSPGAAYPALTVTHDYTRAERFRPSLDTTYAGRYRVNGGPWVTIPATHTVPGVAESLRVIEARPVLTGNYR